MNSFLIEQIHLRSDVTTTTTQKKINQKISDEKFNTRFLFSDLDYIDKGKKMYQGHEKKMHQDRAASPI